MAPSKEEEEEREEEGEEEEAEEAEEEAEESEDFKQGDEVQWKEHGKDTTGVIQSIDIKNNAKIANIRTSDGKNITKAVVNIIKLT